MNIPKEVLVMLAAATDIEKIVEEMHEACSDYKMACLIDNEEQKDKALNKLTMHTHLFILQQMTKGNFEEAIKVINDMNSFKNKMDFFKTDNN
jgi:hypothetical protein